MNVVELATRDLRKAELALLNATRKPNTPMDELNHTAELLELREKILLIVKKHQED